MEEFPRTENDVIALAEAMVAGYTAHPGDFPSVTPEALADLAAEVTDYKTVRDEYGDARSQIRLKTVGKTEQFDTLTQMMKGMLKKSEADCAVLPEKLYQIGWGPRQMPNEQVAPPAQPDSLTITAEGSKDIWLVWE